MTVEQLEASSEIEQARAALPLIQSALLQGQFQEAEQTLHIVLSILGEDADSLNLAVMAALGQGKTVEAQGFADRLLAARPDWPEALLTAAQVAVVAGDFGHGLGLIAQVLDAHPDHSGALALRDQIPQECCGVLHTAELEQQVNVPVPRGDSADLNRGDLTQGEKVAQEPVDVLPIAVAPAPKLRGSSAELIEQGKKEFTAGRYALALEYFEHVLKSDRKHAAALHLKAVTLMQLGRLVESRSIFEAALKVRTKDADLWNHFGSLMMLRGAHEPACKAFKKALALNPRHEPALINLGQYHIERREFAQAETFARRSLAINPGRFEALNNLGVIQIETKRHADAAVTLRKTLEAHPFFAPAWMNLGVVETELGNLASAEACYRRAVELAPEMIDGWKNFSILLERQKRWNEANETVDRGLQFAPEYSALLGQKGNVLIGQMRYQEAIPYYERAIALEPKPAMLYSNLGLAHFHTGNHEEAINCYRTALELDSRLAMAWNNMAGVFEKRKNLPEAIANYQKALECDPNFAEVYNNLGSCFMNLVELDKALAMFQKSIELEPKYDDARSNLLFCLNYHPELTAEEIFGWYRRLGEEVERNVADKLISHEGWNWDGKRKLRIAYLSPDFKGHACRYFIEPLFREHDHTQFEFFAYSNVQYPDEHTERLKTYVDQWRDIVTLSDDDVVAQIAADKIDILVDLAGHTAGNRLMVCARKPAPIQATYMGYGYTTGLKAIDYFLSDAQIAPHGFEHLFSEKPWHLPVTGCYLPDERAPQVTSLPALRNGYVTFGCLARPVRMNHRVIAAWCEILKRIPEAKLRLNQQPFHDDGTRELFWERFAEHGIGRERVILEYCTPHWPAYQQIDITLDPFPHNGGTTTFESIWMGVPVLSKRDRPSVGRLGACVLHAIGMDDWVVDTEQVYIEEAVRRAGDLQELARLRAELRLRIQESLLMQVGPCTQSLEQAYQQMAMEKMRDRS
ncbi:tetratricopeptide repeat protein [Noviherbaspirillum autotrophicum]|uniref:tetratricopeptide repeat protein n=1 Tax=Noviherbaspirillum autotrophicum TaxID=709839 RepID=UPI00058916C3|nr:tetratricopeptide repeat protein [Noviherbaspirillum autotrophicum]